MDAVINRKQTSFRLSEDLINRLREEAKKRNRSLNNLVESILMNVVYNEPNATTKAAMNEARNSESLETLDLSNFKDYVASL